jgi:hypothetical protein
LTTTWRSTSSRPLLKEYGWVEREQVGSELASKYVEPAGRNLPVSDIERVSYAEKL